MYILNSVEILLELRGYTTEVKIALSFVNYEGFKLNFDVAGIDSTVTTIANDITLEKSSIVYGVNGMKQYVKLHYVPAEVNSLVAKTVEKNYAN